MGSVLGSWDTPPLWGGGVSRIDRFGCVRVCPVVCPVVFIGFYGGVSRVSGTHGVFLVCPRVSRCFPQVLHNLFTYV